MKKEDLLKIFGTENPSVEKYQEWVLDNNPETLQPWSPPLNSQVKAVILDPEIIKKPQGRNYFGPVLVEDEEWNSYQDKYLLIEGASLIINHIREAEKKKVSDESILSCLSELEELLKNCIKEPSKYRLLLHNQVMQVLKSHGIPVAKTIDDLKKKFREKKDGIFKNLSEWSTTTGSNEIRKINSLGVYVKKEWFINEEEYNSLQKDIVQRKVEEIKKNPQNWKIFRASGINLPWSGNASYVESKDGKEKFYKTDFSQVQWKEIEKAVGRNYFLALFQSSWR
jgi:hypothetical protein